jgi:hypothetical protein
VAFDNIKRNLEGGARDDTINQFSVRTFSMKRFEFMNRGAVTALAALAALAICPAANAQSVTVNGTQVCTSAPALSMDPAGNLAIGCTPAAPGGGTPTAPTCTVPSVAVTIPAGATTISSATIGAVCSGNPSPTFAWTNNNGAAGFTNPATAAITVGPLGVGSYSFSVVATNSVGTSPTAMGTLIVNAAPAGGGTSGCATTPINAVFTGNGADFPGIMVGGFASYALPQFSAANNSYQLFTAAESNRTVIGLPIEYTVSKCVGDFTSMPTQCTKFGTSNSGMSMYAFEGDTATTNGAGVCVMKANTQYYLNVRTVNADGTNSCTAGACYLYVYANKYTY